MRMARQRGIYVCQSQSFNIYLPEPDIKKLQAVHNFSNALKLKTGMYYLRQNPASQTNRFTVDIAVQSYYNKLTNNSLENPSNEKIVKGPDGPKSFCTLIEGCLSCE